MSGLSLVTKGFLAPAPEAQVVYGGGGGAGLVKRDDVEQKPKIIVQNVKIAKGKEPLTKESVKVTSVKVIIDEDVQSN